QAEATAVGLPVPQPAVPAAADAGLPRTVPRRHRARPPGAPRPDRTRHPRLAHHPPRGAGIPRAAPRLGLRPPRGPVAAAGGGVSEAVHPPGAVVHAPGAADHPRAHVVGERGRGPGAGAAPAAPRQPQERLELEAPPHAGGGGPGVPGDAGRGPLLLLGRRVGFVTRGGTTERLSGRAWLVRSSAFRRWGEDRLKAELRTKRPPRLKHAP